MILAFALDFATLAPIAAAIAIAAVAWLVLDSFANTSSRAEDRLDEMRDPNLRRKNQGDGEGGKGGGLGAMKRFMEKTAPTLAKPLKPKDENAAGKLRMRLMHGGFRSELAPQFFLGLKFAALLAGLTLGGGFVVFSGVSQGTMMRALLAAGLMLYVPDVVLWFLTRKRKESIFLSLPDALDLMVVCVEAGLGLDQAMKKVSDEMKDTYRIISEEFSTCVLQIQMGRTRTEVLHDLGHRNGVDDLRSLASIIIQADKFGSSIAQALRVQSDAMRTRRRQIAEEKAAKTAVKLIFPLVIFIFPGIFVVLVGPAAITMVREMFPAMNGQN